MAGMLKESVYIAFRVSNSRVSEDSPGRAAALLIVACRFLNRLVSRCFFELTRDTRDTDGFGGEPL